MKKHVFKLNVFVAFVLTATLYTSCNLFDKADDISFDTTLDETLHVVEAESGTNVEYQEVITLDATSDPEINKYQNKIKGIKVKKVSYQITSFSGEFPTMFTGSLSFGDASSSTPTVVSAITNLNLKETFDNGSVNELTLSQTDIDKISSLLKDDKSVKMYLGGTLTKTPVLFHVKVIMDVSVEAEAF